MTPDPQYHVVRVPRSRQRWPHYRLYAHGHHEHVIARQRVLRQEQWDDKWRYQPSKEDA